MFIIHLITFDKDYYNFRTNHYYVGQHRTSDLNDNYMGSGVIVLSMYKQFGMGRAKKEILAITETLEIANILEKHFISWCKETYGKQCFNIQKGGRNNLDFVMPEEAHRRNIESLKHFWKNNKKSDSVLLRNRRISESMKGNKNGVGHYHKHSEETKKKISEKLKSNKSRIPKLQKASSKKVYVYDGNSFFEKDNVKYSWKELGFTLEAACQRFTRYCTLFVKGINDVNTFSSHFANHYKKIFVSYEPFDLRFLESLK